MARIRTIKPEFWQDEKLAPLPEIDRLVFLGLISMADDCGRLLDNVKVIDAFIFAESSRTSRESLATLSRIGRVERGKTASGQRVIQIVNWTKHQRVDKPNNAAALPQIVAPSEDTTIRESFANDSGMIRESFALRPTTYDQRPTTDEDDPRASDSGGDAFESWRLRVPATHRDAIHAALRAAQNPDALRREFLGLEHPITGGPAYGPEVVGQAVHDMAVGGVRMGAKALRGYCRNVGEPGRPNAKADLDPWSPEAMAKIGEAA